MKHIFNINPIDIKLLVSVKCSILLVDFLEQEVHTFFDGATATRSKNSISYRGMSESYYGITWDDKNKIIYVVGSELEVKNDHYVKTKICKLTPNGYFIDSMPIKSHMQFAHAHQIHYHKGFVFIADTLNNCVRKIDPNTGDGQTLKIHEDKFGEDFDHVNSVWVDDYIYVLAHGRTRSRIPRIYIFDYNNCTQIDSVEQGIDGAHNIAKLWNQRVVLASYKGALVGEKNQTLIQVGHFTRGLSITNDYIFIGQSIRTDREVRLNSNCGWISVHNSKDGVYIGNVRLDNIGQVHEVRCLNQNDIAHSQDKLR